MIFYRINIKLLNLFVYNCYSYAIYPQDNENLIILSNKNIEVGILPEVGGRIVLLRKPGS